MEPADIEREFKRLCDTTRLWFSTLRAVEPKDWKKLISHNYLYLGVDNSTRGEELPAFLTELLSRRRKGYLEAVFIDISSTFYHPKRNEKLLGSFFEVLSAESRVYLS